MPLYHFNSANGDKVMDREGIDLADIDAARSQAVKLVGEVLAGNPEHLWSSGHWRVEVTNENDDLLFTIMTSIMEPVSEQGSITDT